MGNESYACYTCGTTLRPPHFETGRAVQILGRRFCSTCVDRASELSRPDARKSVAAHAPSGDTKYLAPGSIEEAFERTPQELAEIQRRADERKAPPAGCQLYLKKPGVKGFFGGNLVVLWLDVSTRGGRAVFEGTYATGDPLSLWIIHKGWGQRLEAPATISHVSPSEQHPGASLVGFRFENRTSDLEEFLARIVSESGRSSPTRCLKGKLA